MSIESRIKKIINYGGTIFLAGILILLSKCAQDYDINNKDIIADFNNDSFQDTIYVKEIGRNTIVGISYGGIGKKQEIGVFPHQKTVWYAEIKEENKEGIPHVRVTWDYKCHKNRWFGYSTTYYNHGPNSKGFSSFSEKKPK